MKGTEKMILWEGTSLLDGVTPLVVIATGLDGGSANEKTGGMVQTWILRADIDPWSAIKGGYDAPICGVCPHRGKASGGSGACYVRVYQAPLSVWRAYRRGRYGFFDVARLKNRRVRIGSYGDPMAVPVHVWQAVASAADAVTGYTHQWRTRPADAVAYAGFCMASADSPADRADARALGFRSFRVRAETEPRESGEVVCPASAEGGRRTSCATCLQCGGTGNGRRSDVTIVAHGASRRAFKSLPLAVVV